MRNVCVPLLPTDFDKEQNKVYIKNEIFPYNILILYNILLQAGLKTDIINPYYQYMDQSMDLDLFLDITGKEIQKNGYDFFIIPISYTRDYCNFTDVNLDLLKIVLENTSLFQNGKIVIIGRVLNINKLKDFINRDFTIINLFYQEDKEVVKIITGEDFTKEEHFILQPDIENVFHLKQMLSQTKSSMFEDELPVLTQKGCLFKCEFCQRELIWPDKRVYQNSLTLNKEYIQFFKDHYQIHKWRH